MVHTAGVTPRHCNCGFSNTDIEMIENVGTSNEEYGPRDWDDSYGGGALRHCNCGFSNTDIEMIENVDTSNEEYGPRD